MAICCCSLAGTAACRHCSNNEYAEEPIAGRGVTVPSITVSTLYLSEINDFWKNEYIKEHDARIKEYETSVPVVRCAFCKHYIKHDKRCAVWNHGVHKNDYCSRGQKKEVEE